VSGACAWDVLTLPVAGNCCFTGEHPALPALESGVRVRAVLRGVLLIVCKVLCCLFYIVRSMRDAHARRVSISILNHTCATSCLVACAP
jgi:hypothetical protein